MATSKPIPFPDKQFGMFYAEEDLRDAAYRGDLKRIQDLMRQHPTLDINAADEYSQTPLYIACKKNQNKVAEFLLNQPSIKVNVPTILGNSPMLVCAWNDNTDLAEKLIARGADVHARTSPEREYHGNVSAFDIAQERNNQKLVDLLQPYMTNAATPVITNSRRPS